eukprot:gene25541-biopygen10517
MLRRIMYDVCPENLFPSKQKILGETALPASGPRPLPFPPARRRAEGPAEGGGRGSDSLRVWAPGTMASRHGDRHGEGWALAAPVPISTFN